MYSMQWRVNLDKTVCGVGYYTDDDGERATQLAAAHRAFDQLLDRDRVQSQGQVLLGTPLGHDAASVHLGSVDYRRAELLRMVDDHDARLRAVVGLAKRQGLKGGSTHRISVQLAQALL